MKKKFLIATNLFTILLTVIFLTTIQSTVWLLFFGSNPSPFLALPVIIYVSLYRDFSEALPVVYLLTFAISSTSAAPSGLIMGLGGLLFFFVFLLKQRIFWHGITYFILSTLIGVVVFQLGYLILSLSFEINPITLPEWLTWLAQILYAPLFAPFIFRFLSWVDLLTQKDSTYEAGIVKS